MERVTGIGGFLFRARDPEALARWYHENLGVNPVPMEDDQEAWRQEAGPMVFAPLDQDTESIGDPGKGWLLNFRVRDLDAMAAQLRAAGVEVLFNDGDYPTGRFARVSDPEGNPIELWEPKEHC